MTRSLTPRIENDLQEKFVFLAGPRQVGKTYLAQQILEKLGGRYYNWDLAEDRAKILTKSFIHDRAVVLDELHKYPRWKNFVKGIYDKYHQNLKVLITGSAKLDVYRKGGDSLFGRYFLFHLHPLSVGEVENPSIIEKPATVFEESGTTASKETMENLFKWGGFPEPFYKATEERHNRWSLQRNELLIEEDLRDLTNIHLLRLVEHLMLLLPSKIGSVLSINSLKEDLQVSFNTVKAWLEVLERLYIVFTLRPYSHKLHRSVHKERKLYLWDWSQVKDEGARFENFVASHLWKAVHVWRDIGMGNFDLLILRDRDRREVDFCVTKNHEPWLLVEAKLAEIFVSESLVYYANRFKVPAIQIVKTPNVDKMVGVIRVVSAERWLTKLP